MNQLSSLDTTLEVDLLGFIRSWKYKAAVFEQPSYLVFFKDYSRLDPFCRLWNTDSSIDGFVLRGDNISYTKTVESIELQCNIAVRDNGWDWRISINGSYPRFHRFGIAIPCGLGELNNLGKPVTTSVSQYFRATQDVFPDQTFLDVPIISRNDFSLFCSMKYDVQFFSYQDGEQQYLRLTQSTDLCPEITISCRFFSEPKQLKDHYIDLYPSSAPYLQKWKKILSEAGREQGVEIICQTEHTRIERCDQITDMYPVKENQLERFSEILHKELKKYPPNFLKQHNVDGIMLVGELATGQKKERHLLVGGAVGAGDRGMGWAIINSSKSAAWGLHHEFCHFFEDSVEILSGGFCIWGISTSSAEHLADLFALMMTDENKYRRLSKDHPWVKRQGDIIEKTFPELFSEKACTRSERTIWMISGGEETEIPFGEMPDFIAPVEFRVGTDHA